MPLNINAYNCKTWYTFLFLGGKVVYVSPYLQMHACFSNQMSPIKVMNLRSHLLKSADMLITKKSKYIFKELNKVIYLVRQYFWNQLINSFESIKISTLYFIHLFHKQFHGLSNHSCQIIIFIRYHHLQEWQADKGKEELLEEKYL